MRPPIYLLLITVFSSLVTDAQIEFTGDSLLVTAKLKLGEKRYYSVKEESKIESSPIIPVRAEHEYEVSFTVADTTNGTTILYECNTVATQNKNWVAESIKAHISNGIRLKYTIRPTGIYIDTQTLEQARRVSSFRLDSIIQSSVELNLTDRSLVFSLRDSLQNIRGVEQLIKPMLIFNSVFNRPVFTINKTFVSGYRINILNEIRLPGVIVQQLTKKRKPANTVQLMLDFIGNKESAAQFFLPLFLETYKEVTGKNYRNPSDLPPDMKNNSETKFLINIEGWPFQEINNRVIIFYNERFVSKTIMKLKET